MLKRCSLVLAAAVMTAAVSTVSGQAPGYHIADTYTLGGSGSWDYLAFDGVGHRIFIARSNRVMVVDAATGKPLVGLPGGPGATCRALGDVPASLPPTSNNARTPGFATRSSPLNPRFTTTRFPPLTGATPATLAIPPH